VDLNSYLRIFRRRWSLVLLTVVVGVVAAVVATPASSAAEVDYTATHRLLLQTVKSASGENVIPNNDTVATLDALLSSRDIEQRAAAELGFTGDPAALGRRVRTITTPGELTMSVTATDPDRAQAAAIADAFANSLIKVLEERAQEQQRTIIERAQTRMSELQVELRQLDQRIGTNVAGNSALVAQRAALALEYQRQHQNLEVAEASRNQSGLTSLGTATAKKAGGFVAPRSRAGRGLVAAALGLPIGLALALVVERVDRRIRTKEMAEKAFGLPVLAEVPPMGLAARRHDQVITADQPSSIVAEAYRNLRTSLTLMSTPRGGAPAGVGDDGGVHVILVSSANPGEGKTTTATNLAAAYAEAGEQVLVLDCDFRHPRVGAYLGVEEGPGLSDALGATRSTRLADVVVASQIPGVNVITSGTPVPNPAELFARGHHVLQEATRLADVVIFDTPPILVINDASELLPLVDTVVLTCRSGRTTVDAAERTGELLARLGGPVAGVVLVGSTEAPSSRGHYYYYGTGNKNVPFWRRFGGARGPRGRPPARGARPPAAAPGAKSHAKAKAPKGDRRPRPPAQQPRPKQSAPSAKHAPRQPTPSPDLAEPSRPRAAAPPAAPVGPLPTEVPSAPRQERAAPPPRPEAFAPPPPPPAAPRRAQPDPTDVAPDPIALTDPDETSLDAATPEDVSPSVTPPSPR
jgi:capsular exopolysaccharide synthesis family protein